jgi:ABC-type nitrate/sulfonate/bicarbonate transport system substrate-binding protein
VQDSQKQSNRISGLSVAIAGSLIVLALAGCVGSQNPGGRSAPQDQNTPQGGNETAETTAEKNEEELFVLRVDTPTSFGAFVAADILGMFRDEGIGIEYVGALGKGVTAHQLIEQGETDFYGGGHPPEIAQARLAGIKVKAVAAAIVDGPENNHVRYLVRNDSPIQTLDDIVGHKVATSSVGSCTTGYLQYYLKSKGLNPDDVEFVYIGATGQLEQPLFQGLVDVTTSHPPYGTIALATGEVRQIGSSWDIFQSPGAGMSTAGFLESFIEAHPDVIQGFVNAMYRARTWINQHQEEAKEMASAHFNLEPEYVSTFDYNPDKNIAPEYIEQWFEIAESVGMWEPGDIFPEDVYTNEFVPEDIPESDTDLRWDGQVRIKLNRE